MKPTDQLEVPTKKGVGVKAALRDLTKTLSRGLTKTLSVVMRYLEVWIGGPLEIAAKGRIKTAGYGRRLWLYLVLAFAIGAALRWWLSAAPAGISLMFIVGAVMGMFTFLKQGPVSFERRDSLRAALLRAFAIAAIPIGISAYAWISWNTVEETARGLTLLVAALITIEVLRLERWVFREALGPFHPESRLKSKEDHLIEWIWSGGVTTTEAVVVARLKKRHRKVRSATLAAQNKDGRRKTAESEVSPDRIVRFELSGLKPQTLYKYEVAVNNLRGGSGELTTFPGDAGTDIVIAAGSCASTGSRGRVFETILRSQPQIFIHLGDLHYENIGTDNRERRLDAFDDVLTSPGPKRSLQKGTHRIHTRRP